MPSNQVSAQLRMLVKAGHVAEPAGHPKRRSYLLADWSSNIHYLMRHGRSARSRFDWFVAILRLIFPDQAHADALAKVARQTAECGPEGMRGNLLQRHLGQPAEAEAAYRKAIELDPKFSHPWSSSADLLSTDGHRRDEARSRAIKGLLLGPEHDCTRRTSSRLCADQPADWRAVLPGLASWCASHPKATDVFEFTVDGFIRFARLTKPTEALALLESGTEAAVPFETLRDALKAHADRGHLDRLAPERRVVAIELLNRIKAKPEEP